jgi:predicted N-acyltransferase
MILTSINDIDSARWDAIVGHDALPRSHAYLAATEAAAVHDCQYFYPVIFDKGNTILAHACVYTITTDFAQLLPTTVQRMVRVVRRWWPRFLCALITECASPLMVGHSISVREGEDQQRLLLKITDAVSDIAYAQRSAIVIIRDFLEADRSRIDLLLAHGFQRVSNLPLARIEVRWKSYDEYLASMRARYRKDIKRRLHRAADVGQQVKSIENFGEYAGVWAAQVATVYDGAKGFKREALTADYYVQIAERLGVRSLMLAVERQGRLVAHGLVLLDDATTIAAYFGREQGKPGKEWFVLINEVIRLGIERQSRYIQLGLGSYAAKSLVGASIEPVYIYCKSTLAPVNWLTRFIPNAFPQELKRHPNIFRQDAN